MRGDTAAGHQPDEPDQPDEPEPDQPAGAPAPHLARDRAARGGAPRTVLVTGEGGAGVSTVAAATALAGAHSGARTLLLTSDDGSMGGAPLTPADASAAVCSAGWSCRRRSRRSHSRVSGTRSR